MSQDFLLQVFFHESSSPQLLKIKLGGHFKFFSKIHGEICKTRCTTDIKTPVANLQQVSMTTVVNSGTAGVVDTGGKFATGINDSKGKYSPGVNGTGGKLPLASTTLSVNLPPVSLTPCQSQKMGTISVCLQKFIFMVTLHPLVSQQNN